jgi:hypothetical protein
MNSKAKNSGFEQKKQVYATMKLHITTQLGNLTAIDERFIVERHEAITNYLIHHLSLQSSPTPTPPTSPLQTQRLLRC